MARDAERTVSYALPAADACTVEYSTVRYVTLQYVTLHYVLFCTQNMEFDGVKM